ncbi:MAG: flagellar basal body L-ring protein [Proteobacteria bacterium]|nr:flagellar basal body L-ring protein [Pseudomonadota bacterium]
MKTMFKTTYALVLAALPLAGCAYTEHPTHTPIAQSLAQAAQAPIVPTSVMIPQPAERNPGSLWRPGAKEFFKDSRAANVGDILTIIISESATGAVDAKTQTNKTHNNMSGVTNLLNLTGKLAARGLPLGTGGLVNTDSNRDFNGDAKTDRTDKLDARIAAVVTQVLPNGYLVVQGTREMMVNYEMQQMSIQGIVRPEDISSTNTIDSEKVAEARISYSGKGLVDEAQEPPAGVRFLDKWMPF